MANHELYVVQGKTLDNIAGTMRAVLGVDKDEPIRFDEVASSDKTEQINAEVEAQADLIAQIQTALEGKAASGGGGGGTEEIENLIDQSKVLDSTDGTATEKVEQLIDKADVLKNVRSISFLNNKDITTLTIDCSNLTDLTNFVRGCSLLETIYISNTQNVVSWNYAMFTVNNLTHIYGDIDLSNAVNTSNAFAAPALKHIRFVSETIKESITISSPVLTAESKQSIFDGLAFVTTAKTLTLHPSTEILQSQVDSANAKGWTVAGGTVVSEEEYYG